MRDCSSTAERAVKNELPADTSRNSRPKVNAVKDFRWDDWRRGTKLRMRSCFSPPDLSSVTTGAVLQPAVASIEEIAMTEAEQANKALVIEAFDTLFNRRDFACPTPTLGAGLLLPRTRGRT